MRPKRRALYSLAARLVQRERMTMPVPERRRRPEGDARLASRRKSPGMRGGSAASLRVRRFPSLIAGRTAHYGCDVSAAVRGGGRDAKDPPADGVPMSGATYARELACAAGIIGRARWLAGGLADGAGLGRGGGGSVLARAGDQSDQHKPDLSRQEAAWFGRCGPAVRGI